MAKVRAVPLKHLAAVAVGNGLEFYDFVAFSFFAIYVGRAFFPSHDPTTSLLASLATFGAGFLTRPIGGIVLGGLGDRIGRKPAMLISFGLAGAGMAGLALTPDYRQIGIAAPILVIVFRLVQGFAVGGEVGPSTAFMLEAAPTGKRGLYASLQGVSQTAAALSAAAAGLVLSLALSPADLQAFGWRVAFGLGVAIVPFGLILRRTLPETLGEKARERVSRPRVAGAHSRILIVAFLLFASGTIATYVGAYMTTYAMDTLKLSPAIAFGRSVLVYAIGIAIAPLGGAISDRVGRRPMLLGSYLASLLIAPLAFLAITRWPSLATLYVGTGLLSLAGAFGGAAVTTTVAETLPREIRSGAISTVYAFAIAIFGGTTQFMVKWLIKVTGDPMAPGWYMTGALALGLIAALAARESAPAKVAYIEPVLAAELG